MPLSLQSFLWGLVAGSALVLGAGIGYFFNLPRRVIAAVMAFGSGVLISALSFELMEKALEKGGFDATALGFLAGALIYTGANWVLSHRGAKFRKHSGDKQPTEEAHGGSGTSIALGALLDGIPESIVIGLSLIAGQSVSIVAVCAIFLSNLPEGLSSAAGMKQAGRSPRYIFGVWGGIAVICGVASLVGYWAFRDCSGNVVAATTAVAAGAILAMLVDTMVPEAYEAEHEFNGIITVLGFLAAFFLSHLATK